MTEIQKTLELLKTLVAFDSVSKNPNISIQKFISTYLDEYEINWQIVDYVGGSKENLFATIGPSIDGGLVLSGHTDVVPVENQPWTMDPFKLTIKDGLAYGRGSVDMKGFIACCMALVPYFKSLNLTRPIHFAFSCDEEVGCHGVKPLLAELGKELPQPAACIIGEPTEQGIVSAHKGTITFDTKIKGIEGHSSNPAKGINAIIVAAKLIHRIDQIAEEFQQPKHLDASFEPSYSTINVGTITGGTVKNIIASSCEFRWECRPVPGSDYQSVLANYFSFEEELRSSLKSLNSDFDIETTKINEVIGLARSETNVAEIICLKAAGKNSTQTVSFCTEAGLFQRAHMETVVCGPGSIDQAHKPDEFIAISQLESYIIFLKNVGKMWSEG